jgi:hypothetical protein
VSRGSATRGGLWHEVLDCDDDYPLGMSNFVGCSLQRASTAHNAQAQMVGMSKERVLQCMGPPAQQSAEGQEVWSYASGNGRTDLRAFGQSRTLGSVVASGNYASGSARTYGSGLAIATRRSCTVNVVMVSGRVSAVIYSGPTGGLLSQGEQCAFAIQNCVQ